MTKVLIITNCLLLALLVLILVFKHEIVVVGLLEDSTATLKASWYSEKEGCVHKSCLMANGERFDENKISCASRQFYGQVLQIEYNGKVIECPVTDKISKTYDSERIDLSKKAFETLADLDKGIITIVIK